MNDSTDKRKSQHVAIAANHPDVDRARGYFDEITLRHHALPELDLDKVDTSAEILGRRLRLPLIISSMTGGGTEEMARINRHLAEAAQETGIALALGSQRVMFTQPRARESFAVRRFAPDILLFANLGAVQLNHGFTASNCRDAVQAAEADALFLHLNPLQEAIQPEGDTHFSGLLRKIEQTTAQLDAPVLIKEVGAGLDSDDVRRLLHCGIQGFDVAGAGGTSWSMIEHMRHNGGDAHDIGLIFRDWGIPTPLALLRLRPWREKTTLIASGGVRTGIDMARAVILGARACGMAMPFLRPAMESTRAVVDLIRKIEREFRTAMFLLGTASLKDLWCRESLILDWPPLNRSG